MTERAIDGVVVCWVDGGSESVLPTPLFSRTVMFRCERRCIAGEAAHSNIICAILSPFAMVNFF